jgi:hypothetical protein
MPVAAKSAGETKAVVFERCCAVGRRCGMCGLRGGGTEVLEEADVSAAAVGVAVPRAPDLRDDVEIAVAVDVCGSEVVAAEPGIEDDVLDELDAWSGAAAEEVPTRRGADWEDGRVFLVDDQDVFKTIAVEVGVPKRMERAAGAGCAVGKVMGTELWVCLTVVFEPGDAAILAVAVADDDIGIAIAVEVGDFEAAEADVLAGEFSGDEMVPEGGGCGGGLGGWA